MFLFNVFACRYKGKSYSATVEICDTSDQITDFCRDVCRRLECCPNLISPNSYDTVCPENCLRLAKGKYREWMNICFLPPFSSKWKWSSYCDFIALFQALSLWLFIVSFRFSPSVLQFLLSVIPAPRLKSTTHCEAMYPASEGYWVVWLLLIVQYQAAENNQSWYCWNRDIINEELLSVTSCYFHPGLCIVFPASKLVCLLSFTLNPVLAWCLNNF